jgi:hypothetical protein
LKRAASIFALIAALSACGSPHRFEIRSDEPIQSVDLNLVNMKSSHVRLISPHHASGEARTADSSGEIRVLLVGGKEVICPVRYFTSGEPEPHHVIIKNGRCGSI